jgi:lipopolysaccharide/colanic/teichoic acid biosynthesis glycosyltransferase
MNIVGGGNTGPRIRTRALEVSDAVETAGNLRGATDRDGERRTYRDDIAAIQAVVEDAARQHGDVSFSRTYRSLKRALDVCVAGLCLLVALPLLLMIAVLIRLDSRGPVFFVQIRPGYRGRPLRLLKFRTMVNGSHAHLTSDAVKVRDDPRITRVGQWLRAWSLDELPQLINILRGDMSLVGPRPEILSWVIDNYEMHEYRRFLVPQGLTGWWQVNGRSTKNLRAKLSDDLYYVDHASLLLDLRILAMTIPAVLRREGAF